MDVVITGASRGIGRALALALAAQRPLDRLVLVARDAARLDALAGEIAGVGGRAIAVPGDLSSVAEARALGRRLAGTVEPGAVLVHNAGVWPSKRVARDGGLEESFIVNHLGPLAMQEPLLASPRRVDRIMVVGAGIMVKGRFDPDRTPTGADFSALRTYASTKLAFAVAMRDVAARIPELDVVVLHPGVVRTDLGARPGALGWLLERVKRRWEAPEVCAARLVRVLQRERWSRPGEAAWIELEDARPWPAPAEDELTRRGVRDATERLLPAEGREAP